MFMEKQKNANLERLDRCLVQMLGANAPLCRVYTTEEVTNLLIDQRDKGSSFLEFHGLPEEKCANRLQQAGFRISVSPTSGVFRTKTTVTW
jgi:hypothetical protein